VDRILEDLNTTKTDKTEKGAAGNMLNASPSYTATLLSNTTATPAVEEAAITPADPSSNNKRRVRFKDNLVEIREYEKNPEEWRSFVSKKRRSFIKFDQNLIDFLIGSSR
jgi:hypothetical protein